MEVSCLTEAFAFRSMYSVTMAFCRTFPLVAMMEVGLLFSADAELTGDPGSALVLLL